MRLLAFGLAFVLAGCAAVQTPSMLRASGVPTETFHSAKSVREMVACMTRRYDADRQTVYGRVALDGFYLVRHRALRKPPTIIFLTEDGSGSAATGYVYQGDALIEKQTARLTGIIRQCA